MFYISIPNPDAVVEVIGVVSVATDDHVEYDNISCARLSVPQR